MIKLYHLNHSCHDCIPNTVFNLLPLSIAPGSEFADDYEEWKRAFPGGLSVFGYRHMTPDQNFGEVPLEKAELELKCEFVRRRLFSHIQSRFQSFFALESLQEAITFREASKCAIGISGSIWEIEADRVHHRGDMRLLTPATCCEDNLRAYWEGRPLNGGDPIWECLVAPPVKMIRCVVANDVSG